MSEKCLNEILDELKPLFKKGDIVYYSNDNYNKPSLSVSKLKIKNVIKVYENDKLVKVDYTFWDWFDPIDQKYLFSDFEVYKTNLINLISIRDYT